MPCIDPDPGRAGSACGVGDNACRSLCAYLFARCHLERRYTARGPTSVLQRRSEMAPITRIEVGLATRDHPDAGTRGPVFVGLCRREFSLGNSDLDFQPGETFTYVLGDGANVVDAAY